MHNLSKLTFDNDKRTINVLIMHLNERKTIISKAGRADLELPSRAKHENPVKVFLRKTVIRPQ